MNIFPYQKLNIVTAAIYDCTYKIKSFSRLLSFSNYPFKWLFMKKIISLSAGIFSLLLVSCNKTLTATESTTA